MALSPYCEPSEVRALLGVNAVELSDVVVNLPVYSIGLMRELTRVAPSLPALFTDLPATGRTTIQQRFFDAVRLFSAYAAARQVGSSLGNFTPKDIGDGKANVSRFSNDPYKDVLARLDAQYGLARSDLEKALADLTTIPVTERDSPVHFIAVKRSYDPVTGA